MKRLGQNLRGKVFGQIAGRFLPFGPRAAFLRNRRIPWTRIIAAGLALAIIGEVAIAGVIERRQAQAQLAVAIVVDPPRIQEFFEVEIQEISVDLVRKIILEQVTKKMIEKVVGGQQGGIGGNTMAASNGGQGAMISDYGDYLYTEANADVEQFIDEQFDKQFPSYIDPSIKDEVKIRYQDDPQLTPDNCVDFRTIEFGTDPDALDKFGRSLQIGCNELTAQIGLAQLAALKHSSIVEASKIEATSNSGLLKKDEKSNKIKQSGATYEGIIQSMLQGVVDVQTNNESAVSSIIGALVDQLLDEILDQEF